MAAKNSKASEHWRKSWIMCLRSIGVQEDWNRITDDDIDVLVDEHIDRITSMVIKTYSPKQTSNEEIALMLRGR